MANTNPSSKLTKAQKFAIIAELPAVKSDPMLSEFVAHEMELLAKKNTSDKKPTAQQTANKAIQSSILEVMESGKKYTVTDLLKIVPNLPEDMTNQRMSALVRQMKDSGLLFREEIKRKAYFSIVEE